MFKEMLLKSLSESVVQESVVAPYVGQRLNSIGKAKGVCFTVTFVNEKIVKVKDGLGKEKTYSRKEFENEFSLTGEVSEAVEADLNDGYFTLDFVSSDVDREQVVMMLRDVADMIENGEVEGVLKDEDDEEIGNFTFYAKGEEPKEEVEEEFNDDDSYNTNNDEDVEFEDEMEEEGETDEEFKRKLEKEMKD